MSADRHQAIHEIEQSSPAMLHQISESRNEECLINKFSFACLRNGIGA